jgi:hypothetical protein
MFVSAVQQCVTLIGRVCDFVLYLMMKLMKWCARATVAPLQRPAAFRLYQTATDPTMLRGRGITLTPWVMVPPSWRMPFRKEQKKGTLSRPMPVVKGVFGQEVTTRGPSGHF